VSEARRAAADQLGQIPQAGDALIVVDVQNDFLPGGALAVTRGDEVIAPLNGRLQSFAQQQLPVFVTRDWHPLRHCSFREQGGPWPPHCVAGTYGAELATGLRLPTGARIISKATRSEVDAYSAFQGTDLAVQLRNAGVRRVVIGGLATDYCVRATALDALAAGFAVAVLADAVRAVEALPGDGERSLAELRARGAEITADAAP
jgi:nicotinamidase/pyrazinamidase